MPVPENGRYFVVPLSVQQEGEEYLVGSQQTEDFYQFPKEGLRVIQGLQRGESAGEIKAACMSEFQEDIDVDAFIELLLEVGFIHVSEADATRQIEARREEVARHDKRLIFKANPVFARMVFSMPALLCYAAMAGYALFAAAVDPQLRFNWNAFYIKKDFTAFLLILLVLNSLTSILHELGHMLATARHGIDSRLGIGNRLWNIVAEADLSGIYGLPKGKRYLPLMAGMIVDGFCIALITVLLQYCLATGAGPFLIQVLQALVLQILITITWQFNLFLKTDIYYVFCNYYSYPNLDAEARIYLKDLLHHFSFGLAGASDKNAVYLRVGILRIFSCIWVVGRIAALGLLLVVVLPTLGRYLLDAWHALAGNTASTYDKLDITLFAIISALLLGAGLIMWLRGRAGSNKGNSHVASN